MSIHVQLERFEGPLGLLLHLIREQEMDIFNINIHEITRQYLEYIKAMRRLDLEVAGEFVAMAATLLHIKSRTLLPQYDEDGEEVSEDPRKELVQKLVEYRRIQELSVELYKRPLLGRDVFARGEREQVEAAGESELVLEENPLFSLIASYRTAMKNMKKTVHRVGGVMQSIAARIMEMKDRLVVGRRVVFQDLITASENVGGQVLVTFLSLLELAKMGFVAVFQTEPFADIYIETKKDIDAAAVSRAESYESVDAEAKAEEILAEAQLSLDEPVAQLEGEAEPVVQEGFAEAASDEDIEAEERRLFTEDVLHPVVDAPPFDPVADAVPAGGEPVVIAAVPALAENVSGVDGEWIDSEPAAVGLAEVPLGDITEVGLAMAPEMLTETPQAGGDAGAVLDTIPVVTGEPNPSSGAAQAPPPRPDFLSFLTAPEAPQGADVATEKVNRALSAAVSAFDAFKDDPEVDA